jgi:hypothetical protein
VVPSPMLLKYAMKARRSTVVSDIGWLGEEILDPRSWVLDATAQQRRLSRIQDLGSRISPEFAAYLSPRHGLAGP